MDKLSAIYILERLVQRELQRERGEPVLPDKQFKTFAEEFAVLKQATLEKDDEGNVKGFSFTFPCGQKTYMNLINHEITFTPTPPCDHIQ